MSRFNLAPHQIAGGFAGNDATHDLPLFRPEALAAAGEPMGRPIATLPVAWGVICYSIILMVIVVGVFVGVGTYSRKVTVSGIVRSVGGEIRVEAPATGIISRVLVAEGQRVQAGDTLLVAETPRNDVDGSSLNAELILSLDRDLVRLTSRLRVLDSAAEIERNGALKRMAALDAEFAAAKAQERSSAERLELATDVFERLQPMALKGFISAETMRRRKEEVILLRQGISDARGAQARFTGQIAELRSNVARIPLTLAQERDQIQDAIARVRRERQNYSSQRGFTVKAPASGTVSALQVSGGQSVNPQRPLMTLIRSGRRTSAEIFVPSRSIGFLEPGQAVKVRYDAFPYQRYGGAMGSIAVISSTVLRPEEIEAAIKIDEPVYRVVIDLDKKYVSGYGKHYPIRPGLALEATIVLDERTFANWLLDPIIALRGRL